MKRRSLLKALALPLAAVPVVTAAGWAKGAPKLAISKLEVFRFHVNKRGDWIIPRLSTDGGITGLGDASQSGDDAQTLVYLKQFSELLRGRSIFDVEWFKKATAPIIVQAGGHNRVAAAFAASALEHALWDIQGKALSVPTYELFGGRVQERVRVYANINRSTDPRTPEGFAAMASRAIADGFDAIKLAPFDEIPKDLADRAKLEDFTKAGIAAAQAVRDAIGPSHDLLVDVHSKYDLEDGLDLARRFEPLNLYWLEEVTPAQPVTNLATINRSAKMPTAGGETIHGVAGFYPYIKGEAVDIVMPDVKACGGLLETKKIAALAEGAGLLASPHGPASPVGTAAAAQIVVSTANMPILEFSYGEVPWRADVIYPPEQIVGGGLVLSKRPGFGFTLDPKAIAKYGVAL